MTRHPQWGDCRSYPDTSTPESRESYLRAVREHAERLAQTAILRERERWLRVKEDAQ